MNCTGPGASLVPKLVRTGLAALYHGMPITETIKLIPICSIRGCFQIQHAIALKTAIMKLNDIQVSDFDHIGKDYNFCVLEMNHLDRIVPSRFTLVLFADTYRTVLPLPLGYK